MAQHGGGIAQAPITKESRGRGTAAVRGDTGRPPPSAPTPVIPVTGLPEARLAAEGPGRGQGPCAAVGGTEAQPASAPSRHIQQGYGLIYMADLPDFRIIWR